jgi:aminoglycoside phosphotransferase (APT) family kinase protein
MLLADGLLESPSPEIVPLTGGVSSDIHLVRDGSRCFVVKRALAQLKVAMDWRADPIRTHYERAYLRVVGDFLPEAVPVLLPVPESRPYFAMEYLGDGYSNWKNLLLGGVCETATAVLAGHHLGRIHRLTWGDDGLRREFDNTGLFHQLRVSPYLLTTAERHPALAAALHGEAERLENTREALVHGDYSPKNLLVGQGRLVILDCEVAWFGDPAFDVAFLLTHLHLKAVHLPAQEERLAAMANAFIASYRSALDSAERTETMLQRVARLLPMLLLARVDGKSPAEYLGQQERKQVRRLASDAIASTTLTLAEFSQNWFQQSHPST